MDQKEIETLVEELETRVDRLRALYDQYFMGIEKLEPQVPRKDVERRFYVLRREQIRNTALRFRFHNVLLKFNTYQTYWMRICRQIEEGTYKRDVRRANARFAVSAAGMGPRRADGTTHDTEPPAGAPEAEGWDVDVDFELDTGEVPTLPPPHPDDAELAEALRSYRPPTEGLPPHDPAAAPRAAATARTSYAQKGAGGGRGKRPSEAPIPLPTRMPEVEGTSHARHSPSKSTRRATRPPPAAAPKAPAPPTQRTSRPRLARAVPVPDEEVPRGRGPASPAAGPPQLRAGDLSEERVRQIYTQYVQTKRSMRESTAAITFDSLARSLRDSSQKLREKHGGKTVDFEVAVKDGKTILRPVVK